MVKASYYDKNGLKKGAWSEDEDNKLKAYVQRYGHWNWGLLPKFAGVSRSGKSCRLRWMNYLRPNMKHGNFSKHEDDLVIELHNKLGNKWSAIAAKLPGRSDNEIKNRWNTHLKKRVQGNQTVSKVGTLEPDQAKYPKVNVDPQTYGSSHLAPRTLDDEPVSQQTYGSSHLGPRTLDDESVSQQSCGSSHLAAGTLGDQTAGDFWSEPFVTDNDYMMIPSGDNLLSPLDFVNDFIWQSSCEDNTMLTYEFPWSTLDAYDEDNNMEFIMK